MFSFRLLSSAKKYPVSPSSFENRALGSYRGIIRKNASGTVFKKQFQPQDILADHIADVVSFSFASVHPVQIDAGSMIN